MNEKLLQEPYWKVKQELAKPVPTQLISTRQQGGATIEYINITDYKDLLDQRAGIWEATVAEFKQIGESLCCVVKITVHCDDGIFAQDGTGIEPLNVSGYGDPFSNAYAQAFRRACESHGLSRELWRNEHPQGQQRPQQQTAANNPPQQSTNGNSSQSVARNLGEQVTAKQIGLIRVTAREMGLDPDDYIFEQAGCRPDELSRKAASALIEQMMAKQKQAMPERVPLRRAS